MKLKALSVAALGAALCLSATEAQAQVGYGMQVSRGFVLVGELCEFDCNDPNNTLSVSYSWASNPGDLTVRLFGDSGFPGFVVLGVGNVLPNCGVQLPGFVNPVLMSNVLAAIPATLTTPNPPGRGQKCPPAQAGDIVLAATPFPMPPASVGYTIHIQGLLYAVGSPTLTRACEITIDP